MSICMLTQKTSVFRPALGKQVNFDHPQNNQIYSIPTLKWSQIWSPTPKWSQFRSLTQRKKTPFVLIPKTSDLRPAYKYQVNFYHRHSNQINLITTLKSSQVRSPRRRPTQFRPQQWSQVNFDPHSKSMIILHGPRYENQVDFDSDSKPSDFRPTHKTK